MDPFWLLPIFILFFIIYISNQSYVSLGIIMFVCTQLNRFSQWGKNGFMTIVHVGLLQNLCFTKLCDYIGIFFIFFYCKPNDLKHPSEKNIMREHVFNYTMEPLKSFTFTFIEDYGPRNIFSTYSQVTKWFSVKGKLLMVIRKFNFEEKNTTSGPVLLHSRPNNTKKAQLS